MKNIILIVFVFITSNSFAQQNVEVQAGDLKYSAADSIVTDLKSNTIHLYGRADFKYGKVHFVADEVVVNRTTRQVIASGVIALSVSKVMGMVNSVHKVIKYTMGEDAVFMQ